jgi:hypothetical protein
MYLVCDDQADSILTLPQPKVHETGLIAKACGLLRDGDVEMRRVLGKLAPTRNT